MVNHLEKLLELYPKDNWNSYKLSINPNITWEIVQANSLLPWRSTLSLNPNITWEIVQSNPYFPWCYSMLSQNPNITWEIIQDNPDKDWNWLWVSINPNITWEIVKENLESDDPKRWSWTKLSENPNITWEIIRDNPYYPWDWYGASQNPNITWENMREAPDKPWRYSINPNITPKIVRENPDIDWNFDALVYSMSKIDLEFVLEFEYKFHTKGKTLGRRMQITKIGLKQLANLSLNKFYNYLWIGLSENPYITLEIVQNNPDYPWDYEWMSENPNMTWEALKKQRETSKVNLTWISQNKFEKHPVLIKRKKEKQSLKEVFEMFYKKYSSVERGIEKIISSFLF